MNLQPSDYLISIEIKINVQLNFLVLSFLENAWHLILSQSTVELFNWRSGEQCQYPDLKYETREPSGTVFNDTPVYCGGEALDCFKLDKYSKAWEPVNTNIQISFVTDKVNKMLLI